MTAFAGRSYPCTQIAWNSDWVRQVYRPPILRHLQIHLDSTGRALFGLRRRKVGNAPVGNTLLAETTPINRDKRAQELQRAICPREARPTERAVVV